MQLLQDNPLIRSVQAELSTGSGPGLSILTLDIGTIQLAPFFDIGTAWNNKGQILSPSTLASIGLGLR